MRVVSSAYLILNSISLTNRSLMSPFFLIALARILAGKNEEVMSFLSLLGMLKRIECPRHSQKHTTHTHNWDCRVGGGGGGRKTNNIFVGGKVYIYFYGVKRYLKVCLLCEIFT